MENPNIDQHDLNDLSVNSGINFNSILNSLQYFNVCSGALLPDIFHDMLEGVLPFELKLLLKYLIYEEQFFSLDDLNCAIESIELGELESLDRPSPISYQTLREDGHSLKQQGFSIMCTHYVYTYMYITLSIFFTYRNTNVGFKPIFFFNGWI